MGEITITTEIAAKGPAAAIVLSDAQVTELGEGAKRFPVTATIGETTVRLSVARMRGEFLVGLSRENRQALGVEAGERVEVRLALDAAPREVEVPPALQAALDGDPEAGRAFAGLAYTHRKEFARWIAEAKRDETRARRVEQALMMLHEGRTRS